MLHSDTWSQFLLPVYDISLQALYHLQRGPVLGSMGGHADERAALASLLLNAAQPLAARMLLPAAYLPDADNAAFQPVEPVDLALASGASCNAGQCMWQVQCQHPHEHVTNCCCTT